MFIAIELKVKAHLFKVKHFLRNLSLILDILYSKEILQKFVTTHALKLFSQSLLSVAKLLYKYLCPSVRMSVRQV